MKLLDWLDSRTGIKKITRDALFESIPGGARWRYVWGSTLTFAIVVQFVTGVCLWMAYSPSVQTAWESVNYIQSEMWGGWVLRGIHHYTAQVMVVLLVIHLMQVVIDGAYKAPREVNFWFGIVLLLLVLALSLTGYLLPWDQRGMRATKVSTNLMGMAPLIGPALQKLVIGGTDYGHHTLTRFFALHAGILPGALMALIAGHVWLSRRAGRTVREPERGPTATLWPDQLLKNAVACLAVMAAVLFLVARHRMFSASGQPGAPLGAPADPTGSDAAARPEWYFLFLYQFLKYFPGGTEVVGAIYIPTLVLFIIFMMPLLGKTKEGHRFNVRFLCLLFGGAALLTCLSLASDSRNADYQAALKTAERDAERVKVLAHSPMGVPVSGAITLLREDPYSRGPKLFSQHCASCHRYDGHDGLGNLLHDPQSASDLKGFGSRAWLSGLLDPDRITTTNYFGATKHTDGKMVKFVKHDVTAFTPEQKEQLKKVITAVSAEAQLKSQAPDDRRDSALINDGRSLMKDTMRCTECHEFRAKDENATAPELTGWGSREWIVKMITNPAHPDLYGDHNDRMEAFGDKQILTDLEIGLLADWLRGEWYEPSEVKADQ